MVPNILQICGTWIHNGNTFIPYWWIIFKVISTLYYMVGFIMWILNFCESNHGCAGIIYAPLYMTFQINFIGLVYMILQTYTVIKFRNYIKPELISLNRNNCNLRLYFWNQLLAQFSVVGLTFVAVQYYLLENPSFYFSKLYYGYVSIHVHGSTFIIVALNFYLSYSQIYYKSFVYMVYYGIGYYIFLLIHFATKIGNQSGKRYLYSSFNFAETTAIALVFMCAGSIFIFNSIHVFIKNLILIKLAPKTMHEHQVDVELEQYW